MASVNKWHGIGNLGRDPEVRVTGGGQSVASFSVACSEKFKNSAGEQQERTEWVRITCWGKLAELCGEYLRKGKQVYIEGRLQTREYEKDGQKRQVTEVVANEVKFLGGKDAGGQTGQQEQQARPAQNPQVQRAVQAVNDTFGAPSQDDIPFAPWDMP